MPSGMLCRLCSLRPGAGRSVTPWNRWPGATSWRVSVDAVPMTTASLRLRAAAVQPYNAFCRGTWCQQLGGRSRRVNLVVHFCTKTCKFVQRNCRDGTRQSTRLGHLQSPASARGYCSSVSLVIACGGLACAKVPAVMLHHLKPCRHVRPGHGAADLLATNANIVKKTCDSPAGRQRREDTRKAIRIPPPPGLR